MQCPSRPLIFFFPVILSINTVDYSKIADIPSRSMQEIRSSLVSNIITLRGGFSRKANTRRPPVNRQKDPKTKLRILKKMKVKLSKIKLRQSKLEEYESKWFKSNNSSTTEQPKQLNGTSSSSRSKKQRHLDAVNASSECAQPKQGIESIFKELNSSGLCRSEELDNRVKAFISQLKKSGKRSLVVSALARHVPFRQAPPIQSIRMVFACSPLRTPGSRNSSAARARPAGASATRAPSSPSSSSTPSATPAPLAPPRP